MFGDEIPWTLEREIYRLFVNVLTAAVVTNPVGVGTVLAAAHRLQKLACHGNTGIAVASQRSANTVLVRHLNARLDHVHDSTTTLVVLAVAVHGL
jgi:hypothetical protein